MPGACYKACPSLCGFVEPILLDNLLSVELPRELVVHNVRLGLVNKLIQGIVFFALFIYVFAVEIWNTNRDPSYYGLSAWPENIDLSDVEEGLAMRHCTRPLSYNHSWKTITYMPTECRLPAWGEGWVKESNRIHLFSYMFDFDSMSSTDCGLEANHSCTAAFGVYSFDYGICRCIRVSQYFTVNAEKITLHFYHGFKVETPHQGWIRASLTDAGLGNKKITTRFMDGNGQPCTIDGRTEILRDDITDQGVTGNIRDWLRCAGYDMDDIPSGAGQRELRLMGFKLTLNTHYSNQVSGHDVVCTITPRVSPTWTTQMVRTSTANEGLNLNPFVPEGFGHSRTRVGHGCLIEFEITGDLRFFSLVHFLEGVVNVLLLSNIPKVLMQILCVYALGSMSHIFRTAKRTRFFLEEQERTALARSFMPTVVFRAMLGGDFKSHAHEMPEMKAEHLRTHLEDLFLDHVESRKLEDKHLDRMLVMLCQDEDGNCKSSLSYKDFLRLCNANDVVDEATLIEMMHHKAKSGLGLDKLMDDTDKDVDDKVFRTLTEHSIYDEDEVQSSMDTVDQENQCRVARLLEEISFFNEKMESSEEVQKASLEARRKIVNTAATAQERAEIAELMVRQSPEPMVYPGALADRERTGEAQEKAQMQKLLQRLEHAEKTARRATEDAETVVFRMETLCDSFAESHGAGPKPTPALEDREGPKALLDAER